LTNVQSINPFGWEYLFAGGDRASAQALTMRVLHKSGKPFLILPADPSMARCAMSLYPAQRPVVRLAKAVVRHAAGMGLALLSKNARLTLSSDDSFVRFLARLANCQAGQIPPFAVFAGNPQSPGRRFIVLTFGQNKRPAAVVKAGIGDAASKLIDSESIFLKSLPAGTPGIPKLLDSFQSERISAFSMSFIDGRPAHSRDRHRIESLLAAWVDTTRVVPVSDLPVWQRLRTACRDAALMARLSRPLNATLVHPALFHGDFAPWNVRISGKTGDAWVLDWERGEPEGVPGWDWFHYIIQPAILVRRQSVRSLLKTVDGLLASPAFQGYAMRASAEEIKHELLLAYLLYCVEVLKWSEGLSQVKELLRVLTTKWKED
jgi:Phosphotransferase enzyme family